MGVHPARGPFLGHSLPVHSLFAQHVTPLSGLGNQTALGICVLTHHYQLPDLGEATLWFPLFYLPPLLFPCDYTEPTWMIQANLLIPESVS